MNYKTEPFLTYSHGFNRGSTSRIILRTVSRLKIISGWPLCLEDLIALV